MCVCVCVQVAGLLMTLPSSEAQDLLEKFDEDGDGAFDEGEIRAMITACNSDFLEKKAIEQDIMHKYQEKLREEYQKEQQALQKKPLGTKELHSALSPPLPSQLPPPPSSPLPPSPSYHPPGDLALSPKRSIDL